MLDGESKSFGKPIGVGSILTAELSAIQHALQRAEATAELCRFRRLFLFSDCQSALDLINNLVKPTGSFQLIHTIQRQLLALRAVLQVQLVWVPAHVGVPGNELANTAAKNAAMTVESTDPAPGQPLIPLSTSKAFIKAALHQRRQLRWLSAVACKSGMEHLSRIRTDIARAPAFFLGSKPEQKILSRLRLGHCQLKLSASRWSAGVEENCNCGERESIQHFLLACPRYSIPRAVMMNTVRTVWPHEVTEEVLLGGSGVRMKDGDWDVVGTAVANFVRATGRSV